MTLPVAAQSTADTLLDALGLSNQMLHPSLRDPGGVSGSGAPAGGSTAQAPQSLRPAPCDVALYPLAGVYDTEGGWLEVSYTDGDPWTCPDTLGVALQLPSGEVLQGLATAVGQGRFAGS